MKVVLLGSSGQLGSELEKQISKFYKTYSFSKKDLDITNYDKTSNIIKEINPLVIINASAYTNVDSAEVSQELALEVNFKAVENIAKLAKLLDCFLIHYSTDYVFDGKKKYSYSEKDITNPINFYGVSKLYGEQSIQKLNIKFLIFRVSWVIGSYGSNFVKKITELSYDKTILNVVNDQIGVPTSTSLISRVTMEVIRAISKNKPWLSGIYHLSPKGSTSWFELSKIILQILNETNCHHSLQKIEPIKTSDYNYIAKRPLNSILSTKKIEKYLDFNIPDWKKDYFNVCKTIIANDKSKRHNTSWW